jgi:hemerythrin
MGRLDLTPDLVTGIPEIDDQHRMLIRWANLLLEEDAAPDVVHGSVEFLSRYADAHFRSEEFAMKLFGYDAQAQHLNEHDTFRQQIRILVNRVRDGASVKEIQASAGVLLLRWVASHIGTWDAAFARFLAEDPARRPSSAMPSPHRMDPDLPAEVPRASWFGRRAEDRTPDGRSAGPSKAP